MGPLGFSHHRLWHLFLDPDGWLIPHGEIDDIPPRTRSAGRLPLLEIAAEVLPDAGSLAIFLSRSGSHPVTAEDRSWACELTAPASDGASDVADALRQRPRVERLRTGRSHRVSR